MSSNGIEGDVETDSDRHDEEPLVIHIPWRKTTAIRRREVIVPASADRSTARPIRADTRAKLVGAIARGRLWLSQLQGGTVRTVDEIAAREKCSKRHVSMTISLAFLAPDLVKAAVEGRLPSGIGVARLLDPPIEWARQRAMLLDKQYDFTLHPGDWEPDLTGKVKNDLGGLLGEWLGHEKPITILDLSGVPSVVLIRLVGSILNIIYEAIFWSRDLSEGGRQRPELIVMEEAHRYLSKETSNLARTMVQRIVKEGRKFGIGAMIVSQRPTEIDETILSQCGTFIALRLSNSPDRTKVQAALPDSLSGLMDSLPVLRTGEAIIAGEAAKLPIRCRITLPPEGARPSSEDPMVAEAWSQDWSKGDYDRVAGAWRAQNPRWKPQGPKEGGK